MIYKQFYDLLHKVYDYNYMNVYEYKAYDDLYQSLLTQNIEDEKLNRIIHTFRIKNLAYQGITFNNIHLITDNNIYSNILKCMIEREKYNKRNCFKQLNLHLYYDETTFNYEEILKLEQFKDIFYKKYLYVYNCDIINDLCEYLTINGFEIVYLIKSEKELEYGYKQHILIEITDSNIQNMNNIFEMTKNVSAQKNYFILNTKNKRIKKEYLAKLGNIIDSKGTCEIINRSYLLGEHIGIDENNKFYMLLNTEKFYPTKRKSFKDYYIKSNILSSKCINCKTCLYCITNTSI